jgi:ethanolamine ammonia-lyase small subunit
LPTNEILDFGLSHAMARDAVHLALDAEALASGIRALGFVVTQVHSRAPDRQSYLIRPDWGRRLSDASVETLKSRANNKPIDFLLVVGDGLSSLAVERHVLPLLTEIQKRMPDTWVTGNVVVATQARVALADEVAELMNARMVVILIGERPGLSSPDSLGAYLTFQPHVGCSDADRNCISNIRPEGLNYPEAAAKLIWLAKEAMRMKVSGIALKDESNVKEIGVSATALPNASV